MLSIMCWSMESWSGILGMITVDRDARYQAVLVGWTTQANDIS